MTDGVIITIDMTIKPELAEAVCGGIPAMFAETRRFSGFRAIRAVRHGTEPNRLLIIEHWDHEQDYQAYFAWRNRDGAMDAARAHLLSITTEIWPAALSEE